MKKIIGLMLILMGIGIGTEAITREAGKQSYHLTGTCAFLPAGRTTEFHGSPHRSKLNLAMAGNQWVVFDKIMQGFNRHQGNDPAQPAQRENDASGLTLSDLKDKANRYFIELIPPGQLRKQIKSGCMLLGNDDTRNFLPHNLQVDFDVFASTNYALMQDLANSGFVTEALPYIANRLDLMIRSGNEKGIGNTPITGHSDFDTQFDIIMDLLSGDIIASSLDHINEGIHRAANGYMKKAHQYIMDNDKMVSMTYRLASGTERYKTQLATAWIQDALNAVAIPQNGSPGQLRLISLEAGEIHTSHALSDNNCGSPGAYTFCEFALLNKRNTHETRIHHVETPKGLISARGYTPVDAGFVWITELAYQLNNGNTAVTGMGGTEFATLGIPNTRGVNADRIYSVALLATATHKKRARKFIKYLRSKDGQARFQAAGFTRLTEIQLKGGDCYNKSIVTPRPC